MQGETISDNTWDVYAASFGGLFDMRRVVRCGERELQVRLLRFWTGTPPFVIASAGSFPHEIVLASVVPFGPFDVCAEELVGAAAGRAPLDVVPYAIAGTPFEAVLLLPAGEGTLGLGAIGGAPRYALRAVPITGAERIVAEERPEEVIKGLRRAGALVTDPLRSCTLDPMQTRRFWTHRLPWLIGMLVEHQREAVVQLGYFKDHKRSRGTIAQAERVLLMRCALLAHLGAAPPLPPAGEELGARHVEIAAIGGKLIEKAIGPMRHLLSVRMCEALTELLISVLATHPEAVRHLQMARGDDPGPARFDEASIPLLSNLIAGLHPEARAEELLSVGQHALAEARVSVDPAGDTPLEAHLWGAVHRAVYDRVHGSWRGGADTEASLEQATIAQCFRSCAANAWLFHFYPSSEEEDGDDLEDDVPENDVPEDDVPEDDAPEEDDYPEEVLTPALATLDDVCTMITTQMSMIHAYRAMKRAAS